MIIAQSLLDDSDGDGHHSRNDLLEKSLEAGSMLPTLMTPNGQVDNNVSKKSSPLDKTNHPSNRDSSMSAFVPIDVNQNPQHSSTASSVKSNNSPMAVATTEASCATDSGDLDMTSHGTQTSLPRGNPKRHHSKTKHDASVEMAAAAALLLRRLRQSLVPRLRLSR